MSPVERASVLSLWVFITVCTAQRLSSLFHPQKVFRLLNIIKIKRCLSLAHLVGLPNPYPAPCLQFNLRECVILINLVWNYFPLPGLRTSRRLRKLGWLAQVLWLQVPDWELLCFRPYAHCIVFCSIACSSASSSPGFSRTSRRCCGSQKEGETPIRKVARCHNISHLRLFNTCSFLHRTGILVALDDSENVRFVL